MTIVRSLLLILTVSLSFTAKSDTYRNYESLALGLGPAEAWIMGANQLMEYMLAGPEESSCRFMSEMSASTELGELLFFIEQHPEFEHSGFDDKTTMPEFIYFACIEGGLFSQTIPHNMVNNKVTSEQVIDETILGNSAIVTARFVNGSIKIMHFLLENGVWKLVGAEP